MKRITGLIAIAVALVLALSACHYESTYTGNSAGPKVAIVAGQEVGNGVASTLHTTLDPDYQVRVGGGELVTTQNHNLTEQQTTLTPLIYEYADVTVDENGQITEIGPDAPDVFVFQPPAQDVIQGQPDLFEVYLAHGGNLSGVNEIAHEVGACFVFVNLVYGPQPDVDDANAEVLAAAAEFDYVVADWASVVDANPSYIDSVGNVTTAGEQPFADVIAAAVASC